MRTWLRSARGAARGFAPAPPHPGPSLLLGLVQRGPGWGRVLGVAVTDPCPGKFPTTTVPTGC